jgi:hypothetical protein
MLSAEEPNKSATTEGAEAFLERLHTELTRAFPHAEMMSRILLAVEFGRFLEASAPDQPNAKDNLQLCSRFQLRLFREYRGQRHR